MPEVSWWRSLRERLEVLPFEPWQVLAAGMAAVVFAVGGVGWAVASAGGAGGAPVEAMLPRAGESSSSGAPSSTSVPADVVVHVAGAVARPGVHRVPGGSRVADAIAAAGSATPEADLDRLNLAAPVADGERVYVPRRGEAEPPMDAPAAGGEGRAPPARLNLNTATVEQLEALPGVGPATARAIVEHRTRHGPFRSVRDLLDVRGIGEAKLAALEKLVRT